MSLPNGEASIDIQGVLQDLINNFNALINDLQAQGIDPSFLKNAQVTIHAAISNVPSSTFTKIDAAIQNWRATVAGTSIVATAHFAVVG